MRIAENRIRYILRIIPGENLSGVFILRVAFLSLLITFSLVACPFISHAEPAVDVKVNFIPPSSSPVMDELTDILTDTLIKVLIDSEESEYLLDLDSREVAEGIRTGINVVVEPKGFTVSGLTLDFDSVPIGADVIIHPMGWTTDDPGVTERVEVQIDDSRFGDFWLANLEGLLAENSLTLKDTYAFYLVGLPLAVIDRDWLLDIVLPGLKETDPAPGIFNGFAVTHTVDISQPDVQVTLHLEPETDVIELIRPRMYSHTLYNVILDRLRERINAEANMITGMPRCLVEVSIDELSAHLENAIEQDSLAQSFNAYANVNMEIMPLEPVVRIDVIVESRSYDLKLEALIDFGNESRDSSEVQARFGFLAMRSVEAFVNLNFFTNDATLETDIGLGLRPTRGTFAAIGYDLERDSFKYFLEQEFTTGFMLRGEIFEEDTFNEFGLSYQLQQYLSVGMFTNGDNEIWVRGIFTL